mmetsp:Transcript_38182/g.109005  ORF Transcript_38182/g.109005 Transcript_38182/m.109005 type:complete len:160 (-) Transcript_38182:132-611(-)
MVIKTETCQFSGFKIYPGHGMRYVRTDNRTFFFVSSKCEASFQMRRNPRKLNWTQLYRRLHKKGTTEEVQKKRRTRATKTQRAIVGASLDVIKQKRSQKPEQRAAAREAALREIKERNRAKQAAKKEQKVKTGGTAAAPKQPKIKQPKPAKAKAVPGKR